MAEDDKATYYPTRQIVEILNKQETTFGFEYLIRFDSGLETWVPASELVQPCN